MNGEAGGARVAVVAFGRGPAASGEKPRWPHGVPPRLRSYDRLTLVAVAAATDAAGNAGWDAAALGGDRTALALGTAFGSHLTNDEYYQGVLGRAPVSPRLFTYTLPSSPLGELSIHYKQTGAQDTRCAGWTSGAVALEAAAARLRAGTADRALVVGADAPGTAVRAAAAELAGGDVDEQPAVAVALSREEGTEGEASVSMTGPDEPLRPRFAGAARLEACASAFGDPRTDGAACLARALAAAGRAPEEVDRVLVAAPPVLASAAVEALALAGLHAATSAPPGAASAMGAAPLVALADLAGEPAAAGGPWRLAVVFAACTSGPISVLVVTR